MTLCRDVFSSDVDGISNSKDGEKNCNLGARVPKAYINKYCLFTHVIMCWHYTFMYPGYCESGDELRISQALPLTYINIHSASVHKFLSQDLCWIIHDFLISFVFIHEKSLCFWYWKSICQYNECTNSSQEGTNLGMKEHSAPVYGGWNLHTGAIMHKFQSDIAIDEHMQIISA